jgi:hypothetical protein
MCVSKQNVFTLLLCLLQQLFRNQQQQQPTPQQIQLLQQQQQYLATQSQQQLGKLTAFSQPQAAYSVCTEHFGAHVVKSPSFCT